MTGGESRGPLLALGGSYATEGGGFRVAKSGLLDARHMSAATLGEHVRPMRAEWRASLDAAVGARVEGLLVARAALLSRSDEPGRALQDDRDAFVAGNVDVCTEYALAYAALLDTAAEVDALRSVKVSATLAALDVAYWVDGFGRVRRACLLPLHPLQISETLARRLLGARPGDIPTRLVVWHGTEQVLYPEGRPGFFWSEPRIGVSSAAIAAATDAGWAALMLQFGAAVPPDVTAVFVDVADRVAATGALVAAARRTATTLSISFARSASAVDLENTDGDAAGLPIGDRDAHAGEHGFRVVVENHTRRLDEVPPHHLMVAALACSLGKRVGSADERVPGFRYAVSEQGDIAWIGASGVAGVASYERLVSALGFETRSREWDPPALPAATVTDVLAVACRTRPVCDRPVAASVADEHIVLIAHGHSVGASETRDVDGASLLAANAVPKAGSGSALPVSLDSGHGAEWARRVRLPPAPPGCAGVVVFDRAASDKDVAPEEGCVRALAIQTEHWCATVDVAEHADRVAAALRASDGATLDLGVTHIAWLQAGLDRLATDWRPALIQFERGRWPVVKEERLLPEASPVPGDDGPAMPYPAEADAPELLELSDSLDAPTYAGTQRSEISPHELLDVACLAVGTHRDAGLPGVMSAAARRLLERRGASREALVRRELVALLSPLRLGSEPEVFSLAKVELQQLVSIGDLVRRSEIVGQATRNVVELAEPIAVSLGQSPTSFLLLGAVSTQLPVDLLAGVDTRARARVLAVPTTSGEASLRALRLYGVRSVDFHEWTCAPDAVDPVRLRADYLTRPSAAFTPDAETECLVDRRRDDFFEARFRRGTATELCDASVLVPARLEVNAWTDRFLALFRSSEGAALEAVALEGPQARDEWLRLVAACASLAGTPLKAKTFGCDVALYFETPSWLNRVLATGWACADKRGGVVAVSIPNDDLRAAILECLASRLFIRVEIN